MQFLLVGKGMYPKETLIDKLAEFGVVNPFSIIKEAEMRGRAEHGSFRILRVRY